MPHAPSSARSYPEWEAGAHRYSVRYLTAPPPCTLHPLKFNAVCLFTARAKPIKPGHGSDQRWREKGGRGRGSPFPLDLPSSARASGGVSDEGHFSLTRPARGEACAQAPRVRVGEALAVSRCLPPRCPGGWAGLEVGKRGRRTADGAAWPGLCLELLLRPLRRLHLQPKSSRGGGGGRGPRASQQPLLRGYVVLRACWA